MKRMKKLASLLLAMVMVLSMTVAAFADNTLSSVNTEENPNQVSHTITIYHANLKHNYAAYQIFRGDYFKNAEGKEILSNITWGFGVDGAALLTALQKDDVLKGYFENCKNAEDVAKVLGEYKQLVDVKNTADRFAELVNDHLVDAENGKFATSYVYEGENKKEPTYNETEKKYEYKIDVTGEGYYLVKDSDSLNDGDNDAYTRYIMQVVKNVEVHAKAEIPTIDKKIVVGDERVESNTAATGQNVYYEIKGHVPNYTGYEKYYYVITDTLNSDLNLNLASIKVTVEGQAAELGKGTDYFVYEGSETDDYTFKVAFKNVMNYPVGKEIVVTYYATVDENATAGTEEGKENTVNLTYSNDPNFDYDGKPGDEIPGIPNEDIPKGVTPDVKTLTFVAKIDILKTDENNQPLANAEFTLTGVSKQIESQLVNTFVEDENGEYYKLKDGTYTTDEPHGDIIDPETGNVVTEGNESYYESTETKYKLVGDVDTDPYLYSKTITVKSDEKGQLTFEGLGAGVYTIEETGVPQGYNKAPNVVVEIKCVPPVISDGNENATWSLGDLTSVDENGNQKVGLNDNKQGVYTTTIINKAGSLLPSTGGIGRTIFYAAGIILMAGAMFFVVRRKRA